MAEKGHSQNMLPKSIIFFSNRQLFFQSEDIFHIHNYFFLKINRFQTYSQKKFQIEKPFSNRQKNQKATNLFQIDKIMRNRQIFFKPTKEL